MFSCNHILVCVRQMGSSDRSSEFQKTAGRLQGMMGTVVDWRKRGRGTSSESEVKRRGVGELIESYPDVSKPVRHRR